MKTRFAVFHKHKDGYYKLTRANQGRNHFDTEEEAQRWLDAVAPSLREKVLGDLADTLKVAPVQCHDTGAGDAVSIFLLLETDPAKTLIVESWRAPLGSDFKAKLLSGPTVGSRVSTSTSTAENAVTNLALRQFFGHCKRAQLLQSDLDRLHIEKAVQFDDAQDTAHWKVTLRDQ